jgi:predicted HTH domain antitoxin
MKTLTLTIPDNLDIDKNEVMMMVSSKLFEQGKLSLGQAAEMAGFPKKTYMELLNRYNVSIFGQTVEDVLSDLKNA